MQRLYRLLVASLMLCVGSVSLAATAADEASVRQLWQLLDYVGVDYGGAVSGGAVTRASEYEEMQEFANNALKQAQALPQGSAREPVVGAVSALREAVVRKADAAEVGRLARHASDLLLAAYPVPVAPKSLPDLKLGAAIYQKQCAACHGATGRSDGPLAAKLDPKPVAFADHARARSRSLLALYQIASKGMPGTAMPAFATLSDADRWAVAFYVGTLSYDKSAVEDGARAWREDPRAKEAFADINALTTNTEASIAGKLGDDEARALTAYVRSHPEAVSAASGRGLALTRSRLQESLAAARAGDKAGATRLALSAYLDGFEPLEPALQARNKELLTEVEQGMVKYRSAVSAGDVAQAEAAAQDLERLFTRVETELSVGAADPGTTFLGALTILLREGVEALLIVVGMIAFLRKAQRHDVARYVHAGWITALAAGGATWGAATYVIAISGASREVTEGVSSVFAAIVLLGVGLWMHQKSSAGRWQAYLNDKLSAAMTRRSAWALFALAFIAVYREVFETVLFYSALAVEGSGAALLGGLGAGVVLLGLIAWALLRTSARMPIGKFFSISSVLVAVLAVVLVGKGVAGLQEAGWVAASPFTAPRVEVLGIFPSKQTIAAQFVVLVIAVVGFWMNAVTGRRAARV
ncbi:MULTISPECIES: FTR1 family protein [Ramlibacter]|nr:MULTISPECIES: FTR1 family protein [Ramlibacter]